LGRSKNFSGSVQKMFLVAEYQNIYISRYLVPYWTVRLWVHGRERWAFTKTQCSKRRLSRLSSPTSMTLATLRTREHSIIVLAIGF